MEISLVSLILMAFLISTAAAELDLGRLLVAYLCDDGSGEALEDTSGNGWNADVPGAKWEDGVFDGAIRLQKANSTVSGDIIGS